MRRSTNADFNRPVKPWPRVSGRSRDWRLTPTLKSQGGCRSALVAWQPTTAWHLRGKSILLYCRTEQVVGLKAPFKVKEIWAIRVRLQMRGRLLESTVHCLGIEVDNALEMAEQTEV